MSIRDQAKHRKTLANRKTAIRGLTPLPQEQRHQFNISDVKASAYIQFNQKIYSVEGLSRYQEYNWKLTKAKKYESWELDLFCLNNGERINIEWEKDDKIDVSITLNKIKLSALQNEDNSDIKSKDLEHIVENENSLFLNGKEFAYDDDWAAQYYRDNGTDGINVRFYEFIASDETCLTIEEWMDGSPKDPDTDFDYEVFLSQPLDPDSIEVLAKGNM